MNLRDVARRTGRSGKDSVDHRPGGQDDVANAVAGSLCMALQSVGLKAQLPTDFTRCVNLRASAAESCAFLSRGPHFPEDAHCRKFCVGLCAALPVYKQHQAAARATGEPILTASQFLGERYDHNDLTQRHATRLAITQFEGLIGHR